MMNDFSNLNYHIISSAGSGGMATVYLAEHKLLNNKVAIKVLHQEYIRNENIRKRFLAEAKNMARITHPCIVKVTDLIDQGDNVAFVMEYVEGETLKEYLERKGKLNDADITRIFSQMLEAVGYVHEKKLVHRDIKPSNFMLDKHGNVKLMDFGIAKNTDASSAEYTQTGTGMQMGTPMYMSPEQITETKSVTAQSDIYSLGVVLWQMVMGRKPYDVKTLSNFQLQSLIVHEPLLGTISKWEDIIKIATSKDANQRFKSAKEFLSAMQSTQIASLGISPNELINSPSDTTGIGTQKQEIVSGSKKYSEFSWVVISLLVLFIIYHTDFNCAGSKPEEGSWDVPEESGFETAAPAYDVSSDSVEAVEPEAVDVEY